MATSIIDEIKPLKFRNSFVTGNKKLYITLLLIEKNKSVAEINSSDNSSDDEKICNLANYKEDYEKIIIIFM